MNEESRAKSPQTTRRDFLKTTAVAGAALAANITLLANAHAAGSDVIKVGLVGCGGRGSGAADNVLHSAKNVQIMAIGDVFKFRADGMRRRLNELAQSDEIKQLGNSVDLPEERCHVGLDAYQKVIDSGANYIILATPPGFRPIHIRAVVEAGKNLFTEKPVGTDAPGIRSVLESYEKAKQKGLAVVAGTQRRHQIGYLETMKRVHDGAIGGIAAMRCYWNQGNIWFRKREELRQNGVPDSDLAFQLHNWYHFGWACGDHIVEQHVHNLDVCNWAMGAHPVRAVGMGGRMCLPHGDAREVGNIYDHFAIDYEYPNGVHCMSMCRQIDGCENNVSEALVGTKGRCRPDRYRINDKQVHRGKDPDPYVVEHTDLIASIRDGKPLNELKQVAESTFTAILGRMSAYTGKGLNWSEALASKDSLMPEKLDFSISMDARPVAMPGRG